MLFLTNALRGLIHLHADGVLSQTHPQPEGIRAKARKGGAFYCAGPIKIREFVGASEMEGLCPVRPM